jgi:rod shape determining protein RodA
MVFYEKYAVSFCCFFVIISWLFFGKTIAGQRCWYDLEALQYSSEFAKAATSLALAKFLSDSQINLKEVNRQVQALAIVFYPYSLFFHNQTLVHLIYSIYYCFISTAFWYNGLAFVILHYLLTLVLEPQ